MKVQRLKQGVYVVTIGHKEPIVYSVAVCVEPSFGWMCVTRYEHVFRPTLKSALGYLKEQHKKAVLAECSLPVGLSYSAIQAELSGAVCL